MAKWHSTLTIREIIEEIHQLEESPFVELAAQEEQIREQLTERLACLRDMERRGKELHRSGITLNEIENAANAVYGQYA